MAAVRSRRWQLPGRLPYASWAIACLGWAALAGQAVSCNPILGLKDVRPRATDGGPDQGAAGGGGAAAGGRTGSGGDSGTGGGAGTGGVPGTGGGVGTGGSTGRADTGGAGAGDAGRASCGLELSTNGNFERGMTSWPEAPQGTTLVFRNNDPALIADGVTPHSGQFVLRLGAPSINKYVTHYVEQYINIPADASEITVSGYLQVRTEETVAAESDYAQVTINDELQPTPAFFESTPTWSNLTPAASWTSFSFKVAVASIAGKQMVFRIVANLDISIPTYFYFDTVSVAVTGCSP